jgi:type II secretory pathway component PulJ
LLELLIALGIAAIIVAAQVTPFQETIESRDRAESAIEEASAVRVVLQRIAEELAGTVALAGDGRGFAVEDSVEGQTSSALRFATTGARRLRAGAQDPVEIVRYLLEPDEETRDSSVLVKQQLPSVAPEGLEPAEAVLLENVRTFRVRVLPQRGAEWASTWSGAATGTSSLPVAVELEVALEDGSEDPQVYRLITTLPMGLRS